MNNQQRLKASDVMLNSYIEGVVTRCHHYTKSYKWEDYHAKRL